MLTMFKVSVSEVVDGVAQEPPGPVDSYSEQIKDPVFSQKDDGTSLHLRVPGTHPRYSFDAM